MKKLILLILIILAAIILFCCVKKADNPQIVSQETTIENSEFSDNADTTTEPAMEAAENQQKFEGVKPVNILLMGSMESDFSQDGNAYRLTHILITLDPDNRVVKLTTFPYNLAVNINGGEKQEQLQSLSVGDEKYIVDILEDNFGINIDYWIVMNINGVIEIIDIVKGIEINIESLSINDMADYIQHFGSFTWHDIEKTGVQYLSGVQTAAYFVDTLTETDDWITEEELSFREHHSNIISGLVKSIKQINMNSEDLALVAKDVQQNYDTNIMEEDWSWIADTAIYCLENEPQFLHIPKDIEIIDLPNGWKAISYNEESDLKNIKNFIGEAG